MWISFLLTAVLVVLPASAVEVGHCASNPCEHGRCNNYNDHYDCTCYSGWTGVNCNQDVNECADNNGGCAHNCENTIGSYRCTCRDGYHQSGLAGCTDNNECSINNGGCDHICHNTQGSFYCSCHSGYQLSGLTQCVEIPTAVHNSYCYVVAGVTKDQQSSEQECATKGGSLAIIKDTATQSFVADFIRENNNVSSWVGIKPATFLYNDLSAVQDQQLWAPDQPPALCVYMDSGANYKFSVAACSEEHGFVCQSDIVTCQQDVCPNGGICSSCFHDTHQICTCPPGFTGDQCDINIDECASSPCVNGGVCSDGNNTYTCTCPHGYVGENCENDLDLCDPNPCPFDWNCADNGGHFTCGLKANFRLSDQTLPRCSPLSCPVGMACRDDSPGLYSCIP